jgi:retron-type reverse transcriptase
MNCSFNSKSFPQSWKSAKVMALFKNGSTDDCNNYRPISILPTISKIIERAAYTQFYNYLQVHNLLHMKQFGFRRKRSTSSTLLQFTDGILGNMENGQVTGVVYLDLKKAFDTVNHRILILKLRAMGADDSSIRWFKSYLNNRNQRTVVGNAMSSSRSVNIGVPQGSVLGP